MFLLAFTDNLQTIGLGLMGAGARGSFSIPIMLNQGVNCSHKRDSFKIEVGSPSQSLSVLANTAGQETWIMGRAGCDRCMCPISPFIRFV